MNVVFVTGGTGLLGSSIVRNLIERNVKIKVLARSVDKAKKLFQNPLVEIIEGDILNVQGFANHLSGCDTLFHCAAFFRDNYKGGKHWEALFETNVKGTEQILEAAYKAGIRKAVYTSSIATLYGGKNQLINETMERPLEGTDNYYKSKILAERKVKEFLNNHPDMFTTIILPGWMYGPFDMGPTSSGQLVLDYIAGKMPGILPASFSVVDARDVAEHHIVSLEKGRSGEKYLAAGRYMEMKNIFKLLEKTTGTKMPTKTIPFWLLKIIALGQELYHFITRKPILLSYSSVKLIGTEYQRTHFSHEKSAEELGCEFRPLEDTFKDVVTWYKQNNYIS
ncbi:oxidoreductase [Gilliamella sp. wkB108]|uniref:SDR family oxidoreductase n=1 Tax=Gilliamella sp. wkB108 TaxID=3120256 RepID=UPI00080E0D5E|nr:SDR family oxidoreductase [Gilliamella apicola]OCG20947.1 oxidoreductase [Gilliamella apicola]